MAASRQSTVIAEPKARIFISYSRTDMAFADRLAAALNVRGFEVLIDRTDIFALEDWWQRIESLISRSDTVVFVLSPDAVTSKVALKEVEFAATLNKRFAPIVCRPVQESLIPQALQRLNFVFFDDPAQFDTKADDLADALRTDIGWIRKHTELGEAARRWSKAGRPGPRGLLLRSPTLDEAERWIDTRPPNAPQPSSDISAFIAESRRAARQQRRRRIAMASAFVAVIILGGAAWFNEEWLNSVYMWYAFTRPFIESEVRPYVLTDTAERALAEKESFRECAPKNTYRGTYDKNFNSDHCPDMIVIPAGTFLMGSLPNEVGYDPVEGPQHRVTIPRPIAISKFPVTFNQWETCANNLGCYHNRSMFGGVNAFGDEPAVYMTWSEAAGYAAWLSTVTGKRYRLLSEAEYEYASRAGTQTVYPWGDDVNLNGSPTANCNGCGSRWDNRQTAPVGSFPPNKFGLYDMVGNIAEWVADCSHEDSAFYTGAEIVNYDGAPADGSSRWSRSVCNSHIVRSGSFMDSPAALRTADRKYQHDIIPGDTLGFRVARDLEP